MLQVQNFSAKVEDLRELTKEIFELDFRLLNPKEIAFQAGQYITIRIPNPNHKIIYRAYSIVSSPSEKSMIRLCVKVAPHGIGAFRLRELKPGDVISFRGPMGEFVLNEESKRNILFVTGGTGIAPICSMLERLSFLDSKKEISLYFGVRDREGFFYGEKLRQFMDKLENFELNFCFSREKFKDKYAKFGRVTHILKEELLNINNLDAYICGGQQLILDVKSMLLEKGFNQSAIYFEKFY